MKKDYWEPQIKEEKMKLIISPIDTVNKITLQNIETFFIEGETLAVVFTDGRCRNYPFRHLWYWESSVPAGEDRSKPE